jgi:SAM-dependent methyltransferase
MGNELSNTTRAKEVSHPLFTAFYNRMMGRPLVRRMFDPLRREIVGQAHGIVLEVGAGGGQNFSFYDPARVERVEAVEPDEAMLVEARRSLSAALVSITLTCAPVESLPFPDAQFESVVATLVFCSVHDPERGLREIWRVLKPGGTLLLLEHVRARKHNRLGAGCARATLDPLHGPLPLEPRYLAGGSASWLPGHAGASAQRGTPAHAASARDPFPNAGGDESLQGINPFCSKRGATL